MPDRDHIQFRRIGPAYEWTAVYLNGEFQLAADDYHADEWLADHYGVEIVDDAHSDCMIDNRHALPTLDEVRVVTDRRVARENEAALLRQQADELNRQADAILGGIR